MLKSHPRGRGATNPRLAPAGASGYTADSVKTSVRELSAFSRHYTRVQNVLVNGLDACRAVHLSQPPQVVAFNRPAVEVFLSAQAIHDPRYGRDVATALKVLVRV